MSITKPPEQAIIDDVDLFLPFVRFPTKPKATSRVGFMEASMPCFYLHIKDGGRLIRDEEGIDLPSMNDARAMALQSARELWGDAIKAGRDLGADAFVIVDESGGLTFVPFVEAL